MTIDIDLETQRLIDEELRAGRFPDAATLVGAALRHFPSLVRTSDKRENRSTR
jgi:hypothetical protein